jgi:hypothetical protein
VFSVKTADVNQTRALFRECCHRDGSAPTATLIAIVAFALSFRTLPQGDAIPWPGMFAATFVLAGLFLSSDDPTLLVRFWSDPLGTVAQGVAALVQRIG